MGTGKMGKKLKIITSILNFLYKVYLAIHKVNIKLKTLAQIETDISVIEFFVKERKWTNKGNDKHKVLIL